MSRAATRTVVVVNPAAGGGRAAAVWHNLTSEMPEIDLALTVSAPSAEVSGSELAAALEQGTDRVLVVGGDGTAHQVINVLLTAGLGERVAFGLVPAGTGSDLAKSLGVPRRPKAALRHAFAASPRSIDALEIAVEGGERRFVVNIASAGLSGAVVPAVNARAHRGRTTYLSSTLSALIRYRPTPCRVEVDGEPLFSGGFFLLALANGQYFGKGMRVAPGAALDDGRMEVVLVPPVPLWQLPYRMPQFLTGRHVALEKVLVRRAERVRLEPEPGFPPYDVDGESIPAGPAEVRILPKALRVLA